MHYSQPAAQSCSSREASGEPVSASAIMDPSIPGFSAEFEAKLEAQSQRFEAKLEAQSQRFEARQLDLMTAIQQLQQQMQQMQQMQQSFPKAEKPQSNVPALEQYSQPATPQPTSENKRWCPEEIGQFDGSKDADVYAFTDRLASIAELKGPKLIQINLVTVLKGVAFKWYHYELTDEVKWALNSNESINPWCQALIERFGPTLSDLISQLESTRYTRKDAANKKDATAYIQDLLRIGKGLKWSQSDALMAAFHRFDPALQLHLDPPIDLARFIRQVQSRQSAWFQIYAGYGSSKSQPRRPPSFLPASSLQQQQRPQPYEPSYPSQPSQQRQITNGPPAQPRAYWTEQEEDYNDYIYDAPSDAWIAAPEHPPGHTPRRWGNTHDVGGSEAVANWASAGEDHRCAHQGCAHYH